MFSYKFFFVVNKSRDGKKLLYPRNVLIQPQSQADSVSLFSAERISQRFWSHGVSKNLEFFQFFTKVEWSLPPSFSPSLPSFFPFSFLPSFLSISFSVSVSLYLYLSPYHRENRFSMGRTGLKTSPNKLWAFVSWER